MVLIIEIGYKHPAFYAIIRIDLKVGFNMDVWQQEYFVTIAEECSLTKAAQKLFVSQPSLSQFLSKLESSINAQIFYRKSNNSLSLTEVGKLYYDSSRQVLLIHNEFIKKLSDLKDITSNKMTYGISSDRGLGASFLSKILVELIQKYPDLCIETKQATASKLAELAINCELDFAFSAFEKKNSRLEYIELPLFEITAVMSFDHPLAYLGTFTPALDLPHTPLEYFQNEKFIMLKPDTILRNVLDTYCSSVDFITDIRIETQNIATAFNMVTNSSYVTLCPYNLTPNLKGKFSYIGLDPPLYYNVGVYYNKSNYHTSVMKDFIKVAKRLSTSFI